MFDPLVNNLKKCCTKFIVSVGIAVTNEVKLYKTIPEAFAQDGNHKWFLLEDIIALNDSNARPTGIVCHQKDDKCVISLKTYSNPEKSDHFDYTLADHMEIR